MCFLLMKEYLRRMCWQAAMCQVMDELDNLLQLLWWHVHVISFTYICHFVWLWIPFNITNWCTMSKSRSLNRTSSFVAEWKLNPNLRGGVFASISNPTRQAAQRERLTRWRHISRQCQFRRSESFLAFPQRHKWTICSVLTGDFTLNMLLTSTNWPR
jgi:hypothetical protein